MNSRLYQELQQLSAAEKLSLGEALILSADSEMSIPELMDAHRAELRARLAHHRAHPDESAISFTQLRAKILGTSK